MCYLVLSSPLDTRVHDLVHNMLLVLLHWQRPITLNMGMVMTGWYDLTSLDNLTAEEDEEGIRESWRFVPCGTCAAVCPALDGSSNG